MKEKEIIIGIDVSKTTLDLCVINSSDITHHKINNSRKAITAFFNKLHKQRAEANIVVGMENTGYYNWPTYDVLSKFDVELFVINPIHLKRSIGLTRGKNDKIDALRIAKYIAIHKSSITSSLIARMQIREIQALVAHRKRLIEAKTKLNVPANELSFLGDKDISHKVKKSSAKVILELEKQIKLIEDDIQKIINNDSQLKEIFQYMTSVQGVGKVLAWNMIIKTNEFKSINNPRKLACYSGVVPFDYQSGSSIYQKPRVSFMADKSLKKLLHMAAMSAIRVRGDLQNYYQRKITEGKNKMLVLNAIRNKIVGRICAVVNAKKMYQPNLVLP